MRQLCLLLLVLIFPVAFIMLPSVRPARPTPPEYVRVQSSTYHVIFVNRFADPAVLGDVDYGRHVIRLRAGMAVQDEAEDLMHELLHAMLTDDGTREEMSGHEFIYLVAPKLVETLYADNPQLGNYMNRASHFAR